MTRLFQIRSKEFSREKEQQRNANRATGLPCTVNCEMQTETLEDKKKAVTKFSVAHLYMQEVYTLCKHAKCMLHNPGLCDRARDVHHTLPLMSQRLATAHKAKLTSCIWRRSVAKCDAQCASRAPCWSVAQRHPQSAPLHVPSERPEPHFDDFFDALPDGSLDKLCLVRGYVDVLLHLRVLCALLWFDSTPSTLQNRRNCFSDPHNHKILNNMDTAGARN